MSESIEGNNNNVSVKTDKLDENFNSTSPDLTYLKEMAEGDEVFFNEIITHFLENGPKLLNSLRESVLSEDYEKVRFIAHKLLPQLTFVGILAAVDDVRKIEDECNLMDDLSVVTERVIIIINNGIEDLRKLI